MDWTTVKKGDKSEYLKLPGLAIHITETAFIKFRAEIELTFVKEIQLGRVGQGNIE